MPRFYLCMLYHAKKELKAIMEFAMEPSNYPMVINCTMGKDRTGVAPNTSRVYTPSSVSRT